MLRELEIDPRALPLELVLPAPFRYVRANQRIRQLGVSQLERDGPGLPRSERHRLSLHLSQHIAEQRAQDGANQHDEHAKATLGRWWIDDGIDRTHPGHVDSRVRRA